MLDDAVNPVHYKTAAGIESIDVIEAYRLGFALGNAVKYILRAGRKTKDPSTDLAKSHWYLQRASQEGFYDLQHSGRINRRAPKPEDVAAAFGLSFNLTEVMKCLLKPDVMREDVLQALQHLGFERIR
jgi:hypothetical protein